MEYEPILPLRAIVFQVLFLLVAIAIEAVILRQRLRLSFHNSVKYVAAVNLAAVVVGWIVFLVAEPLSPPTIKAQIISYVLFDRLLFNGWSAQTGGVLFALGLLGFFGTFFIKAKGMELLLRLDNAWKLPDIPRSTKALGRDQRYNRARLGKSEDRQALSDFTDAVILANAASFSMILLLLVLRTAIGEAL